MESNKFFNRRVLYAFVFASFGSASAMAMYDEAKHGVATFIGDGIKTKLIEILADKKKGDWYSSTIGAWPTFSKELPSGQSITVSLCDVASQPRYRSGSSLYFPISNKIIIVLNGEDDTFDREDTNNILTRLEDMNDWLVDTRADRTDPLVAIVFDPDSSSEDSFPQDSFPEDDSFEGIFSRGSFPKSGSSEDSFPQGFPQDSSSEGYFEGLLFKGILEEINVWCHDNNRTFSSICSVNLGAHRDLEELREDIATQVFLSVKDKEACSIRLPIDRRTLTQVRDSNEKYCNI